MYIKCIQFPLLDSNVISKLLSYFGVILFNPSTTKKSPCEPNLDPPWAISALYIWAMNERDGSDKFILLDSSKQISKSFIKCST